MGAITSYECDGDGCKELTEKPKGNQFPDLSVWPRVVLKFPDKEYVGVVHNAACAMSFTDAIFAEREALIIENNGAGPQDPPEEVE